MSLVTTIQPDGTPTWIDLRVPDPERAREFYGALFGWEYAPDSADTDTGTGLGTVCLLRGRPVAAITQNPASPASPTATAATGDPGWTMYFATADCDGTAKRVVDAGGSLLTAPTDIGEHGRTAIAQDPVGARFGLWEARAHLGCEVVNEPDSLVRNDLVTPDPEPARAFYTAVFDYTLDLNKTLPDLDFTFLRRPDGHEIGGIFGFPAASRSVWATTFEVADTDAVVGRAIAAGGTADTPEDTPYGRMATITDPFGVEFSVITRAADKV
ncbi:VOC family protein [Streptomyces sp. NBC_00878]|uniref:VOC family protein n=1 Tax=Streptomyces sp. NBC_00878 TaxID=2975854 RepID=UPI00224E447A|nr:VOC family protein [Streptomyces sp. NBC_00878]MCX4907920.1 VOC family protein [Streptomyces sp. NBC_00878]